MVHGSGKDSLLLLTLAAHRATRASSRRTPSTAPFVFPSSCGGMSRSCIHIFFSGRALKLIRPKSQARSFRLPCGRHAKRQPRRVVHCAWLTANRLLADQTPHRLDTIRERYSNYRCQNCRCSNCRCANLAPWSFTWRERPAWKHGHWEHLDVTHETVKCARGLPLSFPHPEITKVADGPPDGAKG